MNNIFCAAALWVVAVINSGLLLYSNIQLRGHQYLITQCEVELSRNQTCELKAVPKDAK